MTILGLALLLVAGFLHSWNAGNARRVSTTMHVTYTFDRIILPVSIFLLIAGIAFVWASAGVWAALGCVAGYFLVLPLIFMPMLEFTHLIPTRSQFQQVRPSCKDLSTINENALGPDHSDGAPGLANVAEKLVLKRTAGQMAQDIKRYNPYARYEIGDVIYKEYDEPLTVGSKNVEHFQGAVILTVVAKEPYHPTFHCEMLEVDCPGGGAFRKYIEYMKKTRTKVLLPSNCDARNLVPDIIGSEMNPKDKYGWTPLHKAASNGQTDIAEMLIARGADVNDKEKHGKTALHLAIDRGHLDTATLLVTNGADVNSKDKYNSTPLASAASWGRRDEAELLISNGADVNAKDHEGQTPLYWALTYFDKDMVDLLKKYGAKE